MNNQTEKEKLDKLVTESNKCLKCNLSFNLIQ